MRPLAQGAGSFNSLQEAQAVAIDLDMFDSDSLDLGFADDYGSLQDKDTPYLSRADKLRAITRLDAIYKELGCSLHHSVVTQRIEIHQAYTRDGMRQQSATGRIYNEAKAEAYAIAYLEPATLQATFARVLRTKALNAARITRDGKQAYMLRQQMRAQAKFLRKKLATYTEASDFLGAALCEWEIDELLQCSKVISDSTLSNYFLPLRNVFSAYKARKSDYQRVIQNIHGSKLLKPIPDHSLHSENVKSNREFYPAI